MSEIWTGVTPAILQGVAASADLQEALVDMAEQAMYHAASIGLYSTELYDITQEHYGIINDTIAPRGIQVFFDGENQVVFLGWPLD